MCIRDSPTTATGAIAKTPTATMAEPSLAMMAKPSLLEAFARGPLRRSSGQQSSASATGPRRVCGEAKFQ
eukprot:13875004-Alexandrium_andersonii.AAC.1